MNIIGFFRFYRNAQGLVAYMRDAGIHWAKKVGVGLAALVTVIYVISPFDLIPEVLAPVLAFLVVLDDAGVVALCFMLMNHIGMKYAEHAQLPAASTQSPSPSPELPTS
jgi:uncharacterized membrane protein YkvA (DUF1232 family)